MEERAFINKKEYEEKESRIKARREKQQQELLHKQAQDNILKSRNKTFLVSPSSYSPPLAAVQTLVPVAPDPPPPLRRAFKAVLM